MRSRGAVIAVGLLVALASFVHHHSYARHGLALFDLGILFDGTMRTLGGEVFGVDFRAPYGPVRYAALASVFAFTGAKLWVWAEAAAVVLALTGGLLAAECARRGRLSVALLAGVALALAHGSLHKADVMAAQVLSLVALRWCVEGGARLGFASGGLLAVVFLTRYDVGVFAAIAVAVALVLSFERRPRDRWRAMLRCAAGGGVVVGLVALYLGSAGFSFPSWWHDTWLRIGVQERIRVPFPWPFVDGRFALRGDGFLLGGLLVLPALVAASGLGVLWRLVRGRSELRDGLRAGAVLLALGALNQARLIPSANHLFQALPAVLFVIADLLGRPGRRAGAAIAFAGLVLGLFLWVNGKDFGAYPNTYRSMHAEDRLLDGPRAGLYLPEAKFLELHLVIEEIDRLSPPGSALGFGPACALLCFLADRAAAHDFAEPSYYYRDEANQQKVIDGLERTKAPLVVHRDEPTATLDFAEEAPRIAAYLRTHYRLVSRRGDFLLYARIDDGR